MRRAVALLGLLGLLALSGCSALATVERRSQRLIVTAEQLETIRDQIQAQPCADDQRVTVLGVGSDEFDTDLSQFNLGLGYHHSISNRTDLVTEISYINTDIEIEGESEDGDDGRVSVGVRHMLADSFEGWIKGHYTDGDFYDGSFSASIGGQFKFNPTWGAVGEFEIGDDQSLFMIGARASF